MKKLSSKKISEDSIVIEATNTELCASYGSIVLNRSDNEMTFVEIDGDHVRAVRWEKANSIWKSTESVHPPGFAYVYDELQQ